MIIFGFSFVYICVLIYLLISYFQHKKIYKWSFNQYLHKTFDYSNEKLSSDLAKSNFIIFPSTYIFLKVSLVVLVLTLSAAVIQTNNVFSKNEIIENMNMGKSPIDIESSENQDIFLSKSKIIISKLENTPITEDNKELIKKQIKNELSDLNEDEMTTLSEQIFSKLVLLQDIKMDYALYLFLSIISYYFLDILLLLKRRLISLSRDFEMFNLYIAATIYSNIYESHKDVVLALRNHSKYHDYLFDEILLGITTGRDDAYKNVLENIRSDDLFHLMNKLSIQYVTGKKADFQNIAEYKQRSLRSKFTSRRNAKTVFAMFPIAIILILAALYFSMAFQPFLDINNIVQIGG